MNNKKQKNILLLFGGRSGEHEVSLLSARSVYEALDKEKYNVFLVGIDKNGHWRIGEEAKIFLNPTDPHKISLDENSKEVQTSVKGEKVALKLVDEKEPFATIDVIFPIMHGTFGEDGAIQGFLELMNVAYIGSGVLGSAICMDKDIMKRLLRDSGINIANYFCLKSYELNETKLEEIVEELKLPLFIKPANLGSSVGISKVHNQTELIKAVHEAFQYDTKIIFEEFIKGREIEVSVLGNNIPKASVPGEVIPNHEFYSYEAKYLDENGATFEVPAKLDSHLQEQIQQTAVQAFKTLECFGMARIDFFVTEDNRIYLNEINTIPGFTKISMYPRLWEESGLRYSELLNNLIDLAVKKQEQKNKLKRDFSC